VIEILRVARWCCVVRGKEMLRAAKGNYVSLSGKYNLRV
jgi:hypothetical protein